MKNKVIWIAVSFVVGAIVGCAIFWLTCCCCKETCERHSMKSCMDTCEKHSMNCCMHKCKMMLPGVREISLDTAKAYFKCYMKSPILIDTLKCFMINQEQLNAMNILSHNNQKYKGFRVYMGIFGDPEPVSEIVGVNDDGTDDTSTILCAPANYSGPCPPTCDKDSPVTNPSR